MSPDNSIDSLVLYRLDELRKQNESVLQQQGEQTAQLASLVTAVDFLKEQTGQIPALRETVATLKVKVSLRAALVGGLAGGLPAIAAALFWLLK